MVGLRCLFAPFQHEDRRTVPRARAHSPSRAQDFVWVGRQGPRLGHAAHCLTGKLSLVTDENP
eukprot:15481736-Alexandrium_andersonii.AAC.1